MGNEIQTTMPVAPANSANGDMNMMGGSWIWIILIFLLLGGNGGLFGNRDGVGATNATNLINNDFLYTQQKVDNLGQALISQTNQLNQTLNSGFNGVQMTLCNVGHQIDNGFCSTNRNIDQVRFDAAQNTCTITNAITAGNQAILSYLTSQEIANWRERAQAAEARENNANQTAAIINTLRPYPNPSFTVAPPMAFGY